MLINVLENIPRINVNDDISSIIVSTIIKNEIEIHEKDIICVASKVISISENRIVELSKYKPSSIAYEIHKKVPRKDPRLLQAIIEETGDLTGKRLSVGDNYIGAWLKNGLFLTSAGIDRYDERNIILLPNNADISAQIIGEKIKKIFDKNVSVIITDSDGRVDKLGSTQVAIGVYGIPALRYSTVIDISSKKDKIISETICDMLAASAGLLMGQKGRNKPVVIISGFEYEFNNKSSIKESLYNKIIGGIE